jgi:hypothetical protein
MRDNFWVKLLGVAIVIYGLYYLMSPYQNCVRSKGRYADYIDSFIPYEHRGNPFLSAPSASPPPPGFKPVGAQSKEEWENTNRSICISYTAW